MKRKLTLAIALLLMTAILAACGSKPQEVYKKAPGADQKPAAPVTLKIGQLPVVDSFAFWVAEKQEYYKQQGVNVELITFKSAIERDAAMEGGQIDGTMTDIIGAATLYAKGTKVQITSLTQGVTKAESPFAIIASPKSDITKPEQLKGVEIAVSTNSVIDYTTEKMLLENGFKPADIKMINIAQIPVRFEALMSGQVKAATLPEPLLSLAVSKGAKIVLNDANAKKNYSHSVLIFSDKAIKEKADGIKKFYFAYNAAVLDIQTKGDQFRALLAEKAKLPAEIKETFKGSPFSVAQAPAKADVEDVITWLLEKKIITEKITYEQLVNKSLYPQTK